MKLILTYTGELKSRRKDPQPGKPDRLADHINSIRRAFHSQLKEHWAHNPFLSTQTSSPLHYNLDSELFSGREYGSTVPQGQVPWIDLIPELHKAGNFRFLPLVRDGWDLQCELDILFLRKNPPGSLVQAGDIDNRIKTLLDALRTPHSQEEIGSQLLPEMDEVPFYTLLEDDQLISRLNVDTGRLLETEGSEDKNSWSKLVVQAKLKPTRSTLTNLSFV
ncbi:hypothetical protein [uncultured Tateyamaria sp.]|uniref:hypothetical protein n=1 Tax=Tateyamaria sp. 1078 TaxID=3417464 RepID=UPI002611FC72|nr:hypothetical protein [uncultured Tateyamaria sp.]